MRGFRGRVLPALCACIALAGAGCTSGVTHDDTTAALLDGCGKSVKGSKYELCGHWSSTGFAVVGGPGVSAIGSLDSAPRPKGGTYEVKGGTFHGAR
ncbi:MAG: hypothetical protein WBV82_33045 [Myxococcaceae bacterium]